jgi:sulfatase modifying factor 1
MTLVEGDFCPSIRYDCIRPTGAVGCAEYARGNRCQEPTDRRRYCIDHYEWPNKVGENPSVYVDWYEAKGLCQSVGKRLCRRSEWILACEGPKRLPYPWGFVRQPSPCNIDRAAIPFDCVSAFGAYDQSGNVDEWTDNLADDPGTPHPSTLNGGYWGPVRDTCRLTTTSHGPTFKFYQVGFRCCGDATDGVATPAPRPFIDRADRALEP